MKVDEFLRKYRTASSKLKSCEAVVHKWLAQRTARDFLGTSVFGGVTMGDLLVGEGLQDRVDPEVLKAFETLMGPKRDSFDEIHELIASKIELGDASVAGLLNKIQGQVGENIFVEHAGAAARLAESGNQIGWDVVVGEGAHAQYIQVKVYDDAAGVVRKMREVNELVAAGELPDVSQVDFAVNSDVFDEVVRRAEALELPNRIIDLGATRDDIRNLIASNFHNIGEFSGLENFFAELLAGLTTTTAIHAAINAFFVWKGSKTWETAFVDTAYSAAASGAATATFLAVAKSLAMMSVPFAGWMALGVGIGTRTVLVRVADRRHVAHRLREGNQSLRELGRNLAIAH